jgi:hypothetical protein
MKRGSRILVALFVVLVISVLIVARQFAPSRDVFEKWRPARTADRNVLARSIVEQDLLGGFDRQRLIATLGAPDKTNQFGENTLEWKIGHRPSGGSLMFPYEEYLVVYLNEEDQVLAAKILDKD